MLGRQAIMNSLFSKIWLPGLILLLLFSMVAPAKADDERRVRSGLKLFRSVLAADRDLNRKQSIDGSLLVLMVYAQNADLVKQYGRDLQKLGVGAKKGRIRNFPVRVKVIHYSELSQYAERRIAGVFLGEPAPEDVIPKLVNFGINKPVVVYSPFHGDVHKGVLVGLVIDTRIHPLINMDTLKASKIRLKSFFLKVARKYES